MFHRSGLRPTACFQAASTTTSVLAAETSPFIHFVALLMIFSEASLAALAQSADRRAAETSSSNVPRSPAALVMFELLSFWHRWLLRQLLVVQGSVQTPDHQIRSVVRPHQSGSTMQSNTCSGAHKYMWSCLNFPPIQSDGDLWPPHNTEFVVEVTQLKPQFTPRNPIKVEVNLRAVCLSRCRAAIACLAEILSQVQVFFLLCCRRVRPNGVLQRERDSGDQRG